MDAILSLIVCVVKCGVAAPLSSEDAGIVPVRSQHFGAVLCSKELKRVPSQAVDASSTISHPPVETRQGILHDTQFFRRDTHRLSLHKHRLIAQRPSGA
jgi:hypothetical protein